MAVPKSWIPNGWQACKASCRSPKTGRRGGTTYIWCECVEACLNEGRCGCRLVRREKLGEKKYGPVEMVETTCGNQVEKEGGYEYRCYCLERIKRKAKRSARTAKRSETGRKRAVRRAR